MASVTGVSAPPRAGTAAGLSLILPVALSTMGAVLLAPIVPKLFEQFRDVPHANYWIPALLSVPALCIALFSPFVGALADRIGRRRLLIASMIVYSICGVAPLALDSFTALFVSRIGVGICEAVVMTCSTALIGDCFAPAERDRWLGRQAAAASITALCLFPLAGKFGDLWGWRGPFLIYGSALLFLIGVLLFTYEPDRRDAFGQESPSAAGGCTAAFPWRHMVTVCAITVVGGVLFYILLFQMASAMHKLGVHSAANTGMLIAIASLGVPVGALAYGYLKRFLCIRTLLLLELSMMAVGFWGMCKASSPQMFTVPGLLNQIGAGLMLPTLLTWAMQPLSFQNRARGTGIWQSTYAMAQFFSTLTFSLVMTRVGNVQAAFGVFAVLAALSAVLILLFSRFIGGFAEHRAALPD